MHRGTEKGRSGSTRPPHPLPPPWLKLTPEEIENIIVSLARKGYMPSMIGLILRDQYGVPLVKPILGKSILQVLKEHNLEPKIPEDLYNLMKRAEKIRRHLEEHPKDKVSIRGLQLVESKIYRLIKYYKRRGILPPDYKYRPEKIMIA